MMRRCLEVSTSGFYAWACRTPETQARVNARLQERIQSTKTAWGLIGAPRMHEDLAEEGARVSVNRWQACRAGRGGASAASRQARCSALRRHEPARARLQRQRARTKWVTNITEIVRLEGKLVLCVVREVRGRCRGVCGQARSLQQAGGGLVNASPPRPPTRMRRRVAPQDLKLPALTQLSAEAG
jgi:putative transposase